MVVVSGAVARPPAPTAAHAAALGCEAAARHLWDFVDAGLPADHRAEVETHLRACAECAGHVAFARALRGALGASSPAPNGLSQALRARIRGALRAAVRG